MSLSYRKWLVSYAIHVGVACALARGRATLEEIRAEMEDDGLLDGIERGGDVWIADVVRLGPFDRGPGGVLVLFNGVQADDFPHPGKPPARAAT